MGKRWERHNSLPRSRANAEGPHQSDTEGLTAIRRQLAGLAQKFQALGEITQILTQPNRPPARPDRQHPAALDRHAAATAVADPCSWEV